MKELYIQQKEGYYEDVCEALGIDYCYKHDDIIESEDWDIMCGILFDNDVEVMQAAEIMKDFFKNKLNKS